MGLPGLNRNEQDLGRLAQSSAGIPPRLGAQHGGGRLQRSRPQLCPGQIHGDPAGAASCSRGLADIVDHLLPDRHVVVSGIDPGNRHPRLKQILHQLWIRGGCDGQRDKDRGVFQIDRSPEKSGGVSGNSLGTATVIDSLAGGTGRWDLGKVPNAAKDGENVLH
nr:hypothetical protein [Synechococcus sp. CBW1107]